MDNLKNNHAEEQVKIQTLVSDLLEAQGLSALAANRTVDSLSNYIEKDDRSALSDYIEVSIKRLQDSLNNLPLDVDDATLDEEIKKHVELEAVGFDKGLQRKSKRRLRKEGSFDELSTDSEDGRDKDNQTPASDTLNQTRAFELAKVIPAKRSRASRNVNSNVAELDENVNDSRPPETIKRGSKRSTIRQHISKEPATISQRTTRSGKSNPTVIESTRAMYSATMITGITSNNNIGNQNSAGDGDFIDVD